MAQLYPLIDRVYEKTDHSYKDIHTVYMTYFEVVRDVFKDGTHPGVVLTGLMSYQFKASALKYKCKKLTEVIVSENYPALKKRFKVTNIEDARTLLTELIRIYKMKKAFDNQNILSKRRENNGWEN